MPGRGAGGLLERLTIQRADASARVVSSLTRSGTTATCTTLVDHGFTTGDYVTIAGADQTAYNGRVKVTVTGDTTFTYAVSGSPATPATNAMTATYYGDAQGGHVDTWRELATVWGELVPLRSSERLQLAAIQRETAYRFRLRTRTDLSATQRVLWTPRWPPGAAQKTLQIHGVLPMDDGREWTVIDCGEVAA